MAQTAFDLVVIGAGPGGYVAAIRAAQLGMSVAVVEGKHLGGVCLNWGCIPTNALLRTAEIYELMKHAGDFGLTAKEIGFDIKKVVERSRQIADQLSSGVAYLLRKNKVTVFDGNGRLDGPGKVRVEKDGNAVVRLSTKHVILATGARARTLPGIEPDRKLVWTYNEAMVPDIMPGTLLMIGSGAIGIEFASFYRCLGAEVTVVEVLDRILPAEDEEISTFARGQFEKQGIIIHMCTSVKALKKSENTVMATLEGGDKRWDVSADRVILAVGIVGNVETCGLEGSGIRVEKSHIVVDNGVARTN